MHVFLSRSLTWREGDFLEELGHLWSQRIKLDLVWIGWIHFGSSLTSKTSTLKSLWVPPVAAMDKWPVLTLCWIHLSWDNWDSKETTSQSSPWLFFSSQEFPCVFNTKFNIWCPNNAVIRTYLSFHNSVCSVPYIWR